MEGDRHRGGVKASRVEKTLQHPKKSEAGAWHNSRMSVSIVDKARRTVAGDIKAPARSFRS